MSEQTPRWIVYHRCGTGYPVTLDTALDWDHFRETCHLRQLPGPWETILCSNVNTAQDIADWLNARAENADHKKPAEAGSCDSRLIRGQ